MSFVVRQISRTADGREIIRPRIFEGDRLTVGRGTDCDIHLPDLAVTLRHAEIRQAGPARIEIVATAGLPIDINGRSTEKGEIDVARGGNIRLGSHVLAVSRGDGDEAGAIIITVERVGAVSDASEVKDEAKVFSLAGTLPGKRPIAWALALVVLALFLIWPIMSFYGNDHGGQKQMARPIAAHGDESWSPGKLSLVHASLENNCKVCHQDPFVSVRDESCRACHTKVHDHSDPRRLAAARPGPDLGGQAELAVAGAFNVPQGSCVQCHSEHEGATAMPATQQKFCSDCHGTIDKRLTDTKLLNASDFGTDHPQFRPAVMTTAASGRPVFQRVSLDARPIEDNGLKFPHDMHLSKTNGVAKMARSFNGGSGFGQVLVCGNCHVPDASGTRFQPVTMEKNCQMCHSLAFDRIGGTLRTLRHGDPAQVTADIRAYYRSTGPVRPIDFGGMSRRRPGSAMATESAAEYRTAAMARPGRAEAAIRGVFSKGGACFDCHRVTQPGANGTPNFGVVPVRLPDRYMKKGWFDHASHQTETCQSCHAAEKSASAGDLLLPKIESCRTCHGGETAAKAVPSSCAMCHDYHITAVAPLAVRDSRTRGKRRDTVRAEQSGTAGS